MASKRYVLELVGDASSLNRTLKQSSAQANQFEKHMKGTFTSTRSHVLGLTSALVGVGGLSYGLKTVYDKWTDQQKVAAATAAVIKSTGGIAGVTAKQVEELGNAIMRKSTFDSDQIRKSENMLLTFTNVRNAAGKNNDIFNQATQSVADMSAAFKAAGKNMDISQIAILVGKALQDPIKGATALRRVGVSLSSQQADLIKQLVQSGNTMKAQKMILGELTTEFGGAAQAQTKTFAGQIQMLKNRFAEWGAEMLQKSIPYMQQMFEWMKKLWREADKVAQSLGGWKNTLVALGAVWVAWKIKVQAQLVAVVISNTIAAQGVSAAWKAALVATGWGALAVAAGIAAAYVLTHWQKVKTWFVDLWARLQAGFRIVWDALRIGAYKAALDVVEPFSHLPAFLGGWARDAKKNLEKGLGKIQQDMDKNTSVITATWGQAGKTAGNAWADGLVGSIKGRTDITSVTSVGGAGGQGGTHDTTGGRAASRAPSGARLNQKQIAALWVQAGGDPRVATTMAAIAMAESGGRVAALNDNPATGDYSAGLFQTNYFGSMRAGRTRAYGTPQQLMANPLLAARSAVGIYGSQGLSAWSTYTSGAYRQYMTGAAAPMAGTAAAPRDVGAMTAASTKAADAAAAAEKKKQAAAKAAAAAAFKAWKEDYFTPLDNQYKTDVQIPNEKNRLSALKGLLAKLNNAETGATKAEKQLLFNEEVKVQGKIHALKTAMAAKAQALIRKQHDAYVQGLQKDLAAAQTILARQQTLFDRGWARITNKITAAFNKATQAGLQAITDRFSAPTMEEQARDAFQAQLDGAQRAADLASAQGDLVAAQLAGDPEAVKQAQARLGDIQNQQKLQDLQDAADKSRAIANAEMDRQTSDYQAARDEQLNNLNDWLDDQKTALEAGTTTWAAFWQGAFSDAPGKYAPNAVAALQGIIDQQNIILGLQQKIDAASGGVGGSVSLPGGLTVPAGVIGGGFGGAFGKAFRPMAAGGLVTRPTLALVGEAGPEAVVPLSRAGMGAVTVNVYGAVGSPEQIAQVIRRELLKTSRRNGNVGLS